MTFLLEGLLGGVLSGFFKLGWEILLPPRTVERNETNPPQRLMEQIGFSKRFTHQSFLYSGQKVSYISLIIHFGFSIFFGIFYSYLAPVWTPISLWQGTIFGVVIWVVFHLIIMPLMHTVPRASEQPFEEHFSELIGHIIWGFVIHVSYMYILIIIG